MQPMVSEELSKEMERNIYYLLTSSQASFTKE